MVRHTSTCVMALILRHTKVMVEQSSLAMSSQQATVTRLSSALSLLRRRP